MDRLVVVRGAGDLATGTIVRLLHSGFRVIALETDRPTAIRRTVALSEAVYEGSARVEDVESRLVDSVSEALSLAGRRLAPVLVDPGAAALASLRPGALVDAIIAKRNLGTRRGMAPLVIALGPGFVAAHGDDQNAADEVDAVIETSRGHDLGRVILEGGAAPDTGVPGEVGGASSERVLHATEAGTIVALCEIGDRIEAGQAVALVEGSRRTEIVSSLGGVLRGLLRSGTEVSAGFKVADVDPRGRREHCYTVSDKSRAIGGAVLEALLMLDGAGRP